MNNELLARTGRRSDPLSDIVDQMERYCADHPRSPSAVRRPQLSRRGRTFVALLGRNLQSGIAGIGNTVEARCARSICSTCVHCNHRRERRNTDTKENRLDHPSHKAPARLPERGGYKFAVRRYFAVRTALTSGSPPPPSSDWRTRDGSIGLNCLEQSSAGTHYVMIGAMARKGKTKKATAGERAQQSYRTSGNKIDGAVIALIDINGTGHERKATTRPKQNPTSG